MPPSERVTGSASSSGLMDWVGGEPPEHNGLAGRQILEQAASRFNAITLTGRQVLGIRYTAPIVLAVRHRPGPFASSFSFTPEGLRRRPTTDQQSPMRSTVWIFQNNRARYASAVFSTLDTGLAWAAEHEVTGILTEYADGGAYDVAVREGRFTSSKPHHGTPDHVAAFSPGYATSTWPAAAMIHRRLCREVSVRSCSPTPAHPRSRTRRCPPRYGR
jgi:hypothetical protein